MNKVALLRAYLDRLSKDTGWDIMIDTHLRIINDSKEITGYFACNKWHCNPYCVAVKKSSRIHRICLNTRSIKTKKIRKNPVSGWRVCHCGVAEYTIPVIINDFLVATVFATGFVGRLSENMKKHIAKRTDISVEQLDNIRKMALSECDSECQKRLECYLQVAADMIREIAEETPLIKNNSSDSASNEGRLYVLKAIEYIDEKLGEKITLEDIAKHCHISASYLQHLFLKHYGEGVSSYIKRRRMECACELLCSSNRTVREIAVTCGFYDTDYFSIAFKKFYKSSPLAYRKKYKDKAI